MVKRKKAATAEPDNGIDPEAQYSVVVKVMMVVGPTVIRPGPAILKGKYFKDRMSDVDSIQPA